jgi:hypothetical protein
MKPMIGNHISGMNQLAEFTLVNTKLSCPLSKCGAIELSQKAPRLLRTSLQSDQLTQGLFQKRTIYRHLHTSL